MAHSWFKAIVVSGCLLASTNVMAETLPWASTQNITPKILSASEKRQITRIEKYLSSIHTIRARFSQLSPDGTLAAGLFYLQRPGKLRMEYEPPTPVLVVTKDNNLVYHDKELDQVTNVSLDSTLVGFLARDKMAFDDTIKVIELTQENKTLKVSFIQAKRPKDGVMTLEFADAPLTLRNVVLADSGGQTTTVSLINAHFNEEIDPELFVFKDPHIKGNRHIKK